MSCIFVRIYFWLLAFLLPCKVQVETIFCDLYLLQILYLAYVVLVLFSLCILIFYYFRIDLDIGLIHYLIYTNFSFQPHWPVATRKILDVRLLKCCSSSLIHLHAWVELITFMIRKIIKRTLSFVLMKVQERNYVWHVSGLCIQSKENSVSIRHYQRPMSCLFVIYLCLMVSTGEPEMSTEPWGETLM